jgi:hypothetical protein
MSALGRDLSGRGIQEGHRLCEDLARRLERFGLETHVLATLVVLAAVGAACASRDGAHVELELEVHRHAEQYRHDPNPEERGQMIRQIAEQVGEGSSPSSFVPGL